MERKYLPVDYRPSVKDVNGSLTIGNSFPAIPIKRKLWISSSWTYASIMTISRIFSSNALP